MKLTESRVKQIIKEEMGRIHEEEGLLGNQQELEAQVEEAIKAVEDANGIDPTKKLAIVGLLTQLKDKEQ